VGSEEWMDDGESVVFSFGSVDVFVGESTTKMAPCFHVPHTLLYINIFSKNIVGFQITFTSPTCFSNITFIFC